MFTDIKGCANIANGEEQWEAYFSKLSKKQLIEYQYRAENGKLFSCVRPTVEKCRDLRDEWLENNYNL
jgi:hypothetical protein